MRTAKQARLGSFFELIPILLAIILIVGAVIFIVSGQMLAGGLYLLFAVIFLACFYVFSYRKFRDAFIRARLRKSGLRAEGNIKRIAFANAMVNNLPVYAIDVTYIHPVSGQAHAFSTRVLVDYAAAEKLAAAQKVAILIDRQNPDKAVTADWQSA